MAYVSRTLAILAVCLLPQLPAAATDAGDSRTFEFTYGVTIQPGDAPGPVDIFLPIARSTPHQEVLEMRVDSPLTGQLGSESEYGNRFWHARLAELPAEPVTLQVHYRIRRDRFRRDHLGQAADGPAPSARPELARFLQANRRVPVEGELIRDVLADIPLQASDPPRVEARKIYDYVIDTMEYKKVGSGWGNGDTYWACSERYGNCTDYHALFISLARARGIPARFEIGFPVPMGRDRGEIGGYHCWVQLFLPGVGWTPIDASEADKHPGMRELYFGAQPPNRVHFTTGRDLTLDPTQDTGPLNYFVYPLVEVGDGRYREVTTAFHYREPDAPRRAAAAGDRQGSSQ